MRWRDQRWRHPISAGVRASGCAEPGGNRGAADDEGLSGGRHVPRFRERGWPNRLQVQRGCGCGRGRRGGCRVTSQSHSLSFGARRDGQTSGCAFTPASVLAEGWRCTFPHFSYIAPLKDDAEWSTTSGRAVPGARTKRVCGWLRDALLEPVFAPAALLNGPGKVVILKSSLNLNPLEPSPNFEALCRQVEPFPNPAAWGGRWCPP